MAKPSKTLDAVLFLDACMPRIEKCKSGCQSNESVLCRHRFNFNVKILHTTRYIDFLCFYDFQIVLHCLFLIQKSATFRRLVESGNFIIVTKDRKFLEDARKMWLARSNKKTHPKLDFGPDSISWGKYKIMVKLIRCKNYGTDKDDDLRCLIREMNSTRLAHS